MKRWFVFVWMLQAAIAVQAAEQGRFEPLFDGSNLDQWEHTEGDGFRIEDGVLITDLLQGGRDLMTKAEYGNFILRLEFMLSEVGNSGVFLRRGQGFEVQLLAPWTPWRDDLHCTASIYGHVAVTNRPDETTGKWYQMEIVCDRKNLSVSVDGEVCTTANIDEVQSLKNRSLSGRIGLQVNHAEKEGQWAKFRNILIRELDREPAYVAVGLSDQDERVRLQAYDAALALGVEGVEVLARLFGGEDPIASSMAKRALFEMTAERTRPGGDAEVCMAWKEELQKQSAAVDSRMVGDYLGWLAGFCGK